MKTSDHMKDLTYLRYFMTKSLSIDLVASRAIEKRDYGFSGFLLTLNIDESYARVCREGYLG